MGVMGGAGRADRAKPNSGERGDVRIISGRLRGRDLGRVPPGVRPTTDRVRESLFSSLGPLEGTRVLDLFAGTGALGLEAYSRGAEAVVFVERSRRVAESLRRRLDALELEDSATVSLMQCDAAVALRRLDESLQSPFHLVFLDPPYDADRSKNVRETTVTALFASRLLDRHARVVVEGPTRHPLAPVAGARVTHERRYGETLLTWLEPVGAVEE
jgi:16S rRNA (guanine966-N2)-methyltransferase